MFALTAALALLPQNDPAALHAELARLVDLPAAAARERAAEELAQRGLASVASWTAACRTFGTFAPMEPGPARHKVGLAVLDAVEPTELFLFVPKNYDPARPHPLLLWGHGAGGTGAPEYRRWEEVADRIGLLVLAPSEYGTQPGYGFTRRERQAQLAALRWARRLVNVDENAVFVGGCSRGGHLAWDLALRFPDLFAGALPCIGGPRMQLGEQNNLRYLENVVHLPIRDLQGAHDDPLLLVNLRLAFARLQKLGAKDAVLHEFPDLGHDFDLAAVDWAEFFQRRRDPARERVVRVAADPAEASAFWVAITGFDGKVAVDVAPQVNPATWDRLDEAGRRAVLLDRLGERTARLSVVHRGQGRFVAEGKGVRSFVLRLPEGMLGPGGVVEVKWQGRVVKKQAVVGARVLLRGFAERFDRTMLPVVEVAVP